MSRHKLIFVTQQGFGVLMWWSDGDSNPGPSACKADALPTELPPQNSEELKVQSYELPYR